LLQPPARKRSGGFLLSFHTVEKKESASRREDRRGVLGRESKTTILFLPRKIVFKRAGGSPSKEERKSALEMPGKEEKGRISSRIKKK